MCEGHTHEHGHGHRHVSVMENILSTNDQLARLMRKRWAADGTVAVNLLSSPGSGKTALLEATLPRLAETHRVLVLEGDIETERDADRIRARGIDAVTITTGGACHLEANLVEQAWDGAEAEGPWDFVFIENVGNLVCPASYDLGEHLRVVLLSVPEGDDKPAKYPAAFRSADAFVVTKSDLLPHFDFDLARLEDEARAVRPDVDMMVTSATTGEGLDRWLDLLSATRERLRAAA